MALLAAALGFDGVAETAVGAAKVLFLVAIAVISILYLRMTNDGRLICGGEGARRRPAFR